MNINWYPGHMKKTKESLQKNISMVEIVYELLDARIPLSSQNPIVDEIVKDKPRIKILNKSDLSNDKYNKIWKDYYQTKEISTIFMNSMSGKGIDKLISLSLEKTKDKRNSYLKKGVKNKPIKAMILGIPNVGKSTLINSLAGKKGAKIGNKPGITKMNQWIKTKKGLELLDTPGILWPKFEDEKVGLNLAFVGSIKDEILDVETLALKLIKKLIKFASSNLENRYSISTENKSSLEIMEEIGSKRGCIIKGGLIDYTKVSTIILDEFRKGKIGNITLELPEESDIYD
ncbi:MAG: ribosome biogenesis GTPase YlqF [Tissierella sp.]|uniref:ribosome biogenesis GTPase YlqF n=1 Tax=Tissierella sp. TaxID=41274 RepID=UPI003F946454